MSKTEEIMKKNNLKKKFLITLFTAVCFFAVSMPFRIFFQVVSVTEVRPASTFNPLFGLIFGFPAAFGCAVGNLVADLMSGYGITLCILGFLIQLIYGMIPYFAWKSFKCEIRLNTALNVLRYIIIILVDSAVTATLLGLAMKLTGIGTVFSMTTLMLLLNNFVFCMVLGIPILLVYTGSQIKKNSGKLSLNERFILIFLLLAILSATMIGFIAYTELSGQIADPLSLWNRVYLYIAMNLFIFCIVIVCFVFYAEKNITIPMERLAAVTSAYISTEGNGVIDTAKIVDECNKYTSIHGEAGSLAEAFRDMAINIEEYIENLKKVTAEKERIGAELDVAKHIQASMLPCIFPAFPEKREFDIFASMNPAKEVGGDFYDFFLVDENHLAIVMADVSGKGVPAALFMVISKTLLKNSAQNGYSPKEVLERTNNQLCENNDAEMFVTVWLGILEISTGNMKCANAGHEYPAIKRKSGAFELYKDKHGFVLAGMENSKYREYELAFDEGDRLFVYTDGVAEATDMNNNLFGTERMINALNAEKNAGCEQILLNVQRSIDEFVGEAPQFDDITMLAFEMKESTNKIEMKELTNNTFEMKESTDNTPELKKENKITLVPDQASISRAFSFVEENAKLNELSEKISRRLFIAVDEIYSNIVFYSGAKTAEILFEASSDGVKIVFSDDGKKYNPLDTPDPDITLDADERKIGGLGIFMVKKSMREMRYEYRNGRNVLTLISNR